MDRFVRFSAILYKGDYFCDFLFAFLCNNPVYSEMEELDTFFEKEVYPEREEFALGSKFFPFSVDPFSEDRLKHFDRSCFPWKCVSSS